MRPWRRTAALALFAYLFTCTVAPALHAHAGARAADGCAGCDAVLPSGPVLDARCPAGGSPHGGAPCDVPGHPHHNHPLPEDHCPSSCALCLATAPHLASSASPAAADNRDTTAAAPLSRARDRSRFLLSVAPRGPPQS